VTFFSVTVTLPRLAGAPLTMMFEGYGVAGLGSGFTVMAPVLQYWFPVTVVVVFTRWLTDPLLVANAAVPL
jgi:hypothetical protein